MPHLIRTTAIFAILLLFTSSSNADNSSLSKLTELLPGEWQAATGDFEIDDEYKDGRTYISSVDDASGVGMYVLKSPAGRIRTFTYKIVRIGPSKNEIAINCTSKKGDSVLRTFYFQPSGKATTVRSHVPELDTNIETYWLRTSDIVPVKILEKTKQQSAPAAK